MVIGLLGQYSVLIGLLGGLDVDGCGFSAGLGLTVTTGGGADINIGGSSFKLSLDTSIDVVDIWNTAWLSDLLGLDILLLGLSDLT